MHNRTAVRKYIQKLLKDTVTQVSGRVWSGRPSPRFLEMLPCVLISYGPEQVEVLSGSERIPKEYSRRLRMQIDVLTRDTQDPDVSDFDPEENDTAEDEADLIAGEIEKNLSDDWTLGRNLTDWNPELGDGLSLGLRIMSTDPYSIGNEIDVRACVQRITIEVPYITPAFIDKKYATFKEYQADWYKVGYNESTKDPILTSAKGNL